MKIHHAFSLFIIFFSCSEKQDKILPVERSITESVYSSATVQPDSLYQAYASVAGLIDKILVDEGLLVTDGQPLIQIINNTPQLNSQNAKFALNLARENYNGSATILESIVNEIASAKLKFKNDSINFFRQQNLWKQNIGSRAEYDVKKMNYELSQNNLKLLESKYNRTKNELLTAVKQAQNNYKSSLIATKDFTVKSKIDGKIYAIYKEPGEIVNSMEPLASIGSRTNFIVELLVDEVDIVKINKKQAVLITLEAYTGEVFKGKITKIYPKKDERNQTFLVEAVFKNPPEVLYPGLSGEANIVIAKKENSLTIPKSYLIDKNRVKTKDGIVTVTTGLQNMEYVEILSGIDKNTHIYPPE
ncbi:efflux RND transporter periplasmic adaptor subunit [Winogradskyella sp.]|uniref:efflux RND transporter periplasmic adaptor subunit n=1 Tax=Winogradskyella sp. TaxID=1883156 RepID=UPI003F6D62B1